MTTFDTSVLGGILLCYGIALLFGLAIGIIVYVFQSIGLYKMAKNLGLVHAWMAWVPFLNTYTFGKIGSRYIKMNGKPSAKFGGWLLGLEIAMFVPVSVIIGAFIAMLPSLINMDAANPTFTPAIIGSIATMFISFFAMSVIAITYALLYYIALWRMFAIFDNSNATLFLILSIIFSITTPFFIFAIRNNKPALTHFDRIGYISPQTTNE